MGLQKFLLFGFILLQILVLWKCWVFWLGHFKFLLVSFFLFNLGPKGLKVYRVLRLDHGIQQKAFLTQILRLQRLKFKKHNNNFKNAQCSICILKENNSWFENVPREIFRKVKVAYFLIPCKDPIPFPYTENMATSLHILTPYIHILIHGQGAGMVPSQPLVSQYTRQKVGYILCDRTSVLNTYKYFKILKSKF